jgi:hypothetical protein
LQIRLFSRNLFPHAAIAKSRILFRAAAMRIIHYAEFLEAWAVASDYQRYSPLK